MEASESLKIRQQFIDEDYVRFHGNEYHATRELRNELLRNVAKG